MKLTLTLTRRLGLRRQSEAATALLDSPDDLRNPGSEECRRSDAGPLSWIPSLLVSLEMQRSWARKSGDPATLSHLSPGQLQLNPRPRASRTPNRSEAADVLSGKHPHRNPTDKKLPRRILHVK